MSDPIKHGKKIIIESYFDGILSNVKEEFEVSVFSTKETIMTDVINAMEVISDGSTRRLNIEITIDSQNRYRLTKKWVNN